jgi:hypothetical protein
MTKVAYSERFSLWVASRRVEWRNNRRFVQRAEAAFLDNEVPAEHIIRWNVPGSFELIYGAKKCYKRKM